MKKTASAQVRRAPPAGPGRWLSGVALGPHGARRYRLYQPPGVRAGGAAWPLLVMLHGCGQDALAFAHGTKLARLAAREGFCVLFPEQERLANAQGCWNWYETRNGRAFNEAASIVAAVDQVCAVHGIDVTRVAVAGLSAGASMAALLALRYPARFAAVAMHSGVAPGAAHSSASVLGAMQGRRAPAPLADAAGVPPLLVIHGSADHIVAPRNARATAQLWADALDARALPERTLQRGKRYPATLTEFKRGAKVVVGLAIVEGLGHAWSGGAAGQPYSDPKGPDASRMIWAFAARQFRAAAAPTRLPLQSAAKQ